MQPLQQREQSIKPWTVCDIERINACLPYSWEQPKMTLHLMFNIAEFIAVCVCLQSFLWSLTLMYSLMTIICSHSQIEECPPPIGTFISIVFVTVVSLDDHGMFPQPVRGVPPTPLFLSLMDLLMTIQCSHSQREKYPWPPPLPPPTALQSLPTLTTFHQMLQFH